MLGKGGFGAVFEAERRDFGNMKSAIKLISVPPSQTDVQSFRMENYDLDEKSVTSYFYSFVEEFIKEFQIMYTLKGYTNIVNYEDHNVIERKDEFGWDILIRMELLKPVTEYFRDHFPSRDEVIKLGIEV